MKVYSDRQRRAMFANMNRLSDRDSEFSMFRSLGGAFSSFIPLSYTIGDILGDVFWGTDILTRRDPLENLMIGGHATIRPLTLEQIKLIRGVQ